MLNRFKEFWGTTRGKIMTVFLIIFVGGVIAGAAGWLNF